MSTLARSAATEPILPMDETSHTPLLSLDSLSFSYNERSVLDSMTLSVGAGQLVGLLGPNGSGKSTAFAIVAGLLPKGGGRISYRGRPLVDVDGEFRRGLGVVFQSPSIDTRLSCRENLELAAAMQGFRRRESKARANAWLERMALVDRADEVAGNLSGGMRRQLDIARALIGDASLLLMDEPTSGLDERAFRTTWDRLDMMRQELGLTTHRPEEAERCDQIFILNHGRIVASGAPHELRRRVAADVVVITAQQPDEVAARIHANLSIAALVDGDNVLVESDEGHRLLPRIVEMFPAGSFRAISLRRPSLGDVFLKVTGEALGEL